MRTPFSDRLGIDVPLAAFTLSKEVVVAVSRAGGIGVLGAAGHTPERLDEDLAWIRDRVDGKPFGVDMIVPAEYVGRSQGGHDRGEIAHLVPQTHRDFVEGLLHDHGVPALPADIDDPRFGLGGLSWSHNEAVPLIDVALKHGASLLANALGPAPDFMIESCHRAGVAVVGIAGKPEHAAAQRAAGVDIVVAQGGEAGGHTGEISTMVLTPQVVDAVAPLPVLAAGGIATGRQMAAALALGAAGVWCGSVWTTTAEAETPEIIRRKFLAATSLDTVRHRGATGKPARQLRSAWTDAWDDEKNPAPLPMPLQWSLYAPAKARIACSDLRNPGAQALATGMVGQVVGLLNEVRPAGEVLLAMADECRLVLDTLARRPS